MPSSSVWMACGLAALATLAVVASAFDVDKRFDVENLHLMETNKRHPWNSADTMWGKRAAGWNKANTMWGKRAANWDQANTMWGKRKRAVSFSLFNNLKSLKPQLAEANAAPHKQ